MGSSSKPRRFSAADIKENKRKPWKGNQNKNEKKGKGQGKKKLPSFIPKHKYFAKSKLAPYVNEEGSPFYTGKNQDEKTALKFKNIRKALNANNEELCRRLGMGLALDAATLDHGVKAIIKHCGGDWPQEMKEALGKTGIPFIKDALATEEGRAFAEAAQLLNVGRAKKPEPKKVKKAVEKFVKHCTSQGAEWQKHLARLATFMGKGYLMAMTLLKDMALLDNCADWASKFETPQTKAVEAWRKKPQDQKRLLEALTATLLTKIEANETEGRKKRKASDSSDGESSDRGGDEKDDSSVEEAAPGSEEASGDSEMEEDEDAEVPTSSPAPSASESEADRKSTKPNKLKKDKKKEKKENKEKNKNTATDETKKSKTLKEKTEKELKQAKALAKKEKERAAAEEAKTASFTSWRQGDVQLLNNAVANCKAQIGDLPDGKVKKEEILELLAQLPELVKKHFPKLVEAETEIKQAEEEMVSNVVAKRAFVKLAAVTSEAEVWWEEQAGGLTAAASTSS